MYKFLHRRFPFFFGYILRSGIVEKQCNTMYNILRNYKIFPKWLSHLIFPPTVYEGSDFSTSFQILLDSSLRMKWHYCNLEKHFPMTEMLFVGYWCTSFLQKCLLKIFCQLKSFACFGSLFIIEFEEFFVYATYKYLSDNVVCKYILPLYGYFYFLDGCWYHHKRLLPNPRSWQFMPMF